MLDSGRREIAARLRGSMPVLFGRLCVATILIGLADAYPRLERDLNFSDRLVDPVEDGFNLVVRSGPLRNWPGMTARRIAHQRMRVCAAPAYLAAAGVPPSLDDLTSHRAILYGRSGHERFRLFSQPRGPTWTIIPPSRLRLDDVAAERLVVLLRDEPAQAFESRTLWPQTQYLALRVRFAIDALAATLPARIAFLSAR